MLKVKEDLYTEKIRDFYLYKILISRILMPNTKAVLYILEKFPIPL